MVKLVTFLGNPGAQHEATRHNIAWMIARENPLTKGLNWQKKFKGVYAQTTINTEKTFFLKPETYLNKSGESVQALMQFYKINPQEILVVHDDLELDFGQIGFKTGGGLAGHNGLRSIAAALGTSDFHRFRLGISRPSHGDVTSYVLSKFSSEERDVLPFYLERAGEVLEYCLQEGIEAAERNYRKKVVI